MRECTRAREVQSSGSDDQLDGRVPVCVYIHVQHEYRSCLKRLGKTVPAYTSASVDAQMTKNSGSFTNTISENRVS